MKNFLKLFIIFLLLVFNNNVNALTFEEAYSQSDRKPMLVLVTADWAENSEAISKVFNNLSSTFGKTFNYVELDIATNDAKVFNDRYHIYPKLPYVIMFRDRGKVSRYIQRDCASERSCITSKIKSFIQ